MPCWKTPACLATTAPQPFEAKTAPEACRSESAHFSMARSKWRASSVLHEMTFGCRCCGFAIGNGHNKSGNARGLLQHAGSVHAVLLPSRCSGQVVRRCFANCPSMHDLENKRNQLTDLREMQGNLGRWRLHAARSESQLMSRVPSTSLTSSGREPDDITALAPSCLSLCWNFPLPRKESHGRKLLLWSARVRSTEKSLNNAVPAIGSGTLSFASLLPPPPRR